MDTETIRLATPADLEHLNWVAKKYTEELNWVPKTHILSAIERGELLISEPSFSFVIYHKRQDDGVNAIYSIIVPISHRGKGIGRTLVDKIGDPLSLKCPDGLPSNAFYLRCGFKLVKREQSTKCILNVWERGVVAPVAIADSVPLVPTPFI